MILFADVGGTKTLFGLADAVASDGAVHMLATQRYLASEVPSFEVALQDFLQSHALVISRPLRAACFGVAGPVDGQSIQMTNLPWRLDATVLSRLLQGIPVRLVNDFYAAASGIDALGPGDLMPLQANEALLGGHQLVIGAGTGLGVAWRVWGDGRYQIVSGEGGHLGFSPINELQSRCMQRLQALVDRVVVEHFVSGPGLAHWYACLGDTGPARLATAAEPLEPSAQDVIRRAMVDGEERAFLALDQFLLSYGAAAAGYALMLLARGGVFVAGGIAVRLGDMMRDGRFMSGFHRQGPYEALLKSLPVNVVTQADLGLLGAALEARKLLNP
ncbi:MAG: glucokinase [Burkholderiales bacterium]|nr:glucokinase [Burkholderiales bacterium]